MIYKPTWVANAFLKKAKSEGINDIDQLKIQKLVYCLNGWNLAVHDEAIIGEQFEAWPYGPVLCSLYHEFKSSGRSPIKNYAKDIDPKTGKQKVLLVSESNKDFYDVFEPVWERYKTFSGIQLSALTHADGTPWQKARYSGRDYLDDEEIRDHFIGLVGHSK